MKTKVIKVDINSPDKSAIEFAATLLRDGGLVSFPTETVYGIGANYFDEKAIKRLCKVKKRPKDKPFTIHISSIDTIEEIGCEITPEARRLIDAFWPGPLTLIFRGRGAEKFGFRMPKNTLAKELISECGVPLAVPSANLSGDKPPVRADEILKKFDGKIDLILDGGKTEFGMESTVLDMTHFPYKILRKGAIPESEIERIAISG